MSPTLQRFALLIAGWFGWWCRELAALVPRRLAESWAGERDLVIVDIGPSEVAIRHRTGTAIRDIARAAIPAAGLPARPPALARLVTGGRRGAIVRLAPETAVTKLVQLPDSAAANLRAILEHQLERHTPIEPAQLRFDVAVSQHDRTQKRLTVELAMVLRSTIDAVEALARDWQLAPRAIGLIDPDDWRARFNFAAPRQAEGARALRRRVALAGLAGVLACAAAYTTLDHQERRAAALERIVAEAKAEAQAAARLRADIAKRVEQRDFLGTKRHETPRLQILNEIARVLGDDTWLTDLQLAGNKVRITGFTTSASNLIPLLQQQPTFANPRFESPVTRAVAGGGERFDLSLEIAGVQRLARP
jgi:general secretion pathway protein L